MTSWKRGFSLIEFMVSMTLLTILFAGVMTLFVPLMNQSKIQRAVGQTQVEGIVGLELFRMDLNHAGEGLPRTTPVAYTEAANAPASDLNDASNPPRPVVISNNTGLNTSDYIALKGVNLSLEDAAHKYTFIQQGDVTPHVWGNAEMDLEAEDRVIVLRLVDPDAGTHMALHTSNNAFWQRFSDITAPTGNIFENEIWYVFGIDNDTDPRMPFNRADYFISQTSVPTRCLAGTGVLVKSVVDQSNGAMSAEVPLLDCVADFQVALGVDITIPPDGQVDCVTNDLADVLPAGDLTADVAAQTIRNRVREVQTFVLAQEGTFDRGYTYEGGTTVEVGASNSLDCTGGAADANLGKTFDLTTLGNTFKNHRWKVFRMTVHPQNITQSLVNMQTR